MVGGVDRQILIILGFNIELGEYSLSSIKTFSCHVSSNVCDF